MIKTLINEIKWFVQRGRRGWADKDIENTGDYLAKIIPEMIDAFKDYNVIYPPDFKTHDGFVKEMEKISAGFYAWQLLKEDNWYDDSLSQKENQKACVKANKEAQKSLEQSCKLLAKHFGNLWD